MAQPTTTPKAASASAIARQREEIRSRIINAAFLKSHIILYIIVNVILVLINAFTSAYPWYLWALTSWGLALAIHIFTHTSKSAGILSYHIFIYLIVNLFLVFVNWFTTETFSWVIWPIFGWGIGLLGHIILYVIFMPGKNEDPSKTWMDRKIENELKTQNKSGNSIIPPSNNVLNTQSDSNGIICSKCNTINLKTADFCASCGQKL